MVRATMHGGPRDGEEVLMPWANIELAFFRFDGPGLDGVGEARYRLRGPWRGQLVAAYDYVEPLARKRRPRLRRLIRWLWLRWA